MLVQVPGAAARRDAPQTNRERLDAAVNGLRRANPGMSAYRRLSPGQSVRGLLWLAAAAAAAWAMGPAIWTVAALAMTLPFTCITLLRSLALWHYTTRRRPRAGGIGLANPQPHDAFLPTYSLLIPLYREARVVPALMQALRRLDYPASRLEVLFITEQSDDDTRAALLRARLAANMRIITVPEGRPRTKPRALNYALSFARGQYVAVYDAEDAPEPGQLKMAVRAFRTRRGRIGCVQARLDIYTPAASFLTRQFTLEYMALFYGLLPAFQRFGIPVPLGGTSNHFPRAVLNEAGGWDPYNVTEDADLGLRLARKGYGVAMIGSTTWEEAPVRWRQWFGQRTRWIKGWIQTYLVHTRRPVALMRELGLRGWLGFHLVFGGLLFSALVHPWSYAFLAWSLATDRGGDGVRSILLDVCLFNMLASYAAAILLALAVAIRRRRFRLALSAIWTPFYWLLISLAAYRAVLDFMWRPHHWRKTAHTGAGRQQIDASGRCRPQSRRPHDRAAP
jgi:cellulose synthase/poly-beta-1,6-N-acetylglucosamine synthase-like glycosyltransferase